MYLLHIADMNLRALETIPKRGLSNQCSDSHSVPVVTISGYQRQNAVFRSLFNAREHDITKSLLYKWEKDFLERGAELFRSTEIQTQEFRFCC